MSIDRLLAINPVSIDEIDLHRADDDGMAIPPPRDETLRFEEVPYDGTECLFALDSGRTVGLGEQEDVERNDHIYSDRLRELRRERGRTYQLGPDRGPERKTLWQKIKSGIRWLLTGRWFTSSTRSTKSSQTECTTPRVERLDGR